MYLPITTPILYFTFVLISIPLIASAFDDWNPLNVRDFGDHIPGPFGKEYQNLEKLLVIQGFINRGHARRNQRSSHEGLRRRSGPSQDEFESALSRLAIGPTAGHVLTPAEVDHKINEMTRVARNFKECIEIRAVARLYGDRIAHPEAKEHYFAVHQTIKYSLEKEHNKLKDAGRRQDAKRFKKAADKYVESFGKFYDIWLAEIEKRKKALKEGAKGEFLTGIEPLSRDHSWMILDQRVAHQGRIGPSKSKSDHHGERFGGSPRAGEGASSEHGWKSIRGRKQAR